MEKSKKKSNDNYGPKIKLFICVQAAAHTSFLVAVPVFWVGEEKQEKQREKYMKKLIVKNLPYGIFPVLRAVHMMKRTHFTPKPAEKPNHPQSPSLSLFFSVSLITFLFIFLDALCVKRVWKNFGME